VKVLRESGDERVELRESLHEGARSRCAAAKRSARDLVALRLNPWWYPHDIYTPKDAAKRRPVHHRPRHPQRAQRRLHRLDRRRGGV
jgi:hypothetical protein